MKRGTWVDIEKFLKTATAPDLGPGPRPGVESESNLLGRLGEALADSGLPARQQQLVRALVLLWHDHLDAAHTIAQAIDDADGAFVHGIMHRREPDFGNARYWFRRVGSHVEFPQIASRVQAMGSNAGSRNWVESLVPGGRWDAFAFIDACERASQSGGEGVQLLQQIQRIESEVLLERFAR